MVNVKALPLVLTALLSTINVHATETDDFEIDVRGAKLGDLIKQLHAGDNESVDINYFLTELLIEGQYKGTKKNVLDSLANDYDFSFSERGGVLKLYRSKESIDNYIYNLDARELPISQLVAMLAKSNSIRADIDSTIDETVSGQINGTLNDILTDLALEHSLLIHSNADSVSIVKHDRERKITVDVDEYLEQPMKEWISIQQPDSLYPGNEITYSADMLTISGHPYFVELKSVEAKSIQPFAKQISVGIDEKPITDSDSGDISPVLIKAVESVVEPVVKSGVTGIESPAVSAGAEQTRTIGTVQRNNNKPSKSNPITVLENIPGFY